MEPLLLAAPDLAILLVIVLVLFGGSRLAGLGKGTGRALREFKEETRGLRDPSAGNEPPTSEPPSVPPAAGGGPDQGPTGSV